MNNIFGFENLAAYQRALDLVDKAYDLMKGFPSEEKFALCDQLRRASVSITSNIAEGVNRFSVKDKAHFIEIAFGSMMEVWLRPISSRLGIVQASLASPLAAPKSLPRWK